MKKYSERYITITKQVVVVVWSENTRYGFRHLAELKRDYMVIETAKCCYYNRTWERYEFESVLQNLLGEAEKSKSLTTYELRKFKRIIANGGREESKKIKKEFNAVAMVASLGEIFGTTQKDKNDWKLRMIKAGLESKGLQIPEDWDTLTEDEKETRLNKVINSLNK